MAANVQMANRLRIGCRRTAIRLRTDCTLTAKRLRRPSGNLRRYPRWRACGVSFARRHDAVGNAIAERLQERGGIGYEYGRVDAMLTKEAILPLVNARLNRVLLIAQAALPEHQFEAFRRLILDEFGRAGLIRDLDTILGEIRQERHGTGRTT